MRRNDTAFRNAVRRFIASTDADEIYHALTTQTKHAIGCDGCRIVTIPDDDGDPCVGASALSEPIATDQSNPLTLEIAGQAHRTASTSIINDITFTRSTATESPGESPSTDSERSVLTAPVGDYAVLQALDHTPGTFSQRDLEWIEDLISHAEIALARVKTPSCTDLDAETIRQTEHERMLDIVSGIAHDLRNPLNVADGYLSMAREDATAADNDVVPFDKIEQAHERVEQLIDDMLTLGGKSHTIAQDSVGLRKIAKDSWEGVPTDESAARLVVEGTVRFRANPSSARRVFENLFRNAVEHAGPTVTVRVGPLDGEPGFYVADNGPGIPEAAQARMVESEITRGSIEKPAGLGLTIIRRIAETHEWKITVGESEAGGARFEITDIDAIDEPS